MGVTYDSHTHTHTHTHTHMYRVRLSNYHYGDSFTESQVKSSYSPHSYYH